MLSSVRVPFQGGQNTHLSILYRTLISSLFLFISRVTHVILSSALTIYHGTISRLSKVRNTKQIPVSLMETSKQRDIKRLTSNSPNKGNLFILRTASLDQPQGRDGEYPFTVHSPREHIVSRMKSRGVLF